MTDKADKVHPIIEAMARAISIARGGTAIGWPSHIREAKAAARVLLLNMAPTKEMLEGGAQAYEDSPCMDLIGPLEAAYKAMTAALAKEIEDTHDR